MIIYYKESSDVVVFIRTVKGAGRTQPYPKNSLKAFNGQGDIITIRSVIEDDDNIEEEVVELDETNEEKRGLIVLMIPFKEVFKKGKVQAGETKEEVIDYLNKEFNREQVTHGEDIIQVLVVPPISKRIVGQLYQIGAKGMLVLWTGLFREYAKPKRLDDNALLKLL